MNALLLALVGAAFAASVTQTIFAILLWKRRDAFEASVLQQLAVLTERRTPVSTTFEAAVLDGLSRLEPPPVPKPLVPPEVREPIVAAAVEDGILTAERYAVEVRKRHPKEVVTGADKHNEAVKQALKRLTAAGIETTSQELAMRVVQAYSTMKAAKRV